MEQVIALILSTTALAVSITTAWLTLFHRGRVDMTIPSMVVFAYDANPSRGFDPKVMVRCLLFSTSQRGQVIEMLYARLQSSNGTLVLNTWGLQQDKMERGGGLFVGKQGVTAWHHFVGGFDDTKAKFRADNYQLTVFGRVHGVKNPVLLWSTSLIVPDWAVPPEREDHSQVWFDRDPDSSAFVPRRESRTQ